MVAFGLEAIRFEEPSSMARGAALLAGCFLQQDLQGFRSLPEPPKMARQHHALGAVGQQVTDDGAPLGAGQLAAHEAFELSLLRMVPPATLHPTSPLRLVE
jgi:hypothetical protein